MCRAYVQDESKLVSSRTAENSIANMRTRCVHSAEGGEGGESAAAPAALHDLGQVSWGGSKGITPLSEPQTPLFISQLFRFDTFDHFSCPPRLSSLSPSLVVQRRA